MLFLFFSLLIIGGCGLIVGNALLIALDPEDRIDRAGDRAILAVWLGIVLLSNLFLGVSLFLPLSPVVAVCTVLPAFLISIGPAQNRAFLQQLIRPQRLKLFGAVVPMVCVSIAGTQIVHWYDSGLYHIQVIKWLSEFGLVPGLALIHSRFGFVSSWFTVAAPFNHGVFEGRVASLPGSFCLLMLLVGWTIVFFRIMQGRGRGQDWFLLTASSLAIPLIVLRWIAPSPSPDLPVMVLAIYVGWAVFAVADAWRQSPPKNEKILHIGMLPLILAAGAVTVKLSALPLLAVSFVFYLFGAQSFPKIRNFLAAGSTILVILTPVAAAGVITTGCAFYPVPFFCTDLPWSLGRTQALRESTIITEWARWNGPTPHDAATLGWLVPWIKADEVFAFLILLTLVSTVVVLVISSERFRDRDGYIVAVALLGMVFMFLKAPTWRFGFGYVFIIPALAASILQNRFGFRLKQAYGKMEHLATLALVGILVLFIIPSGIVSQSSHELIARTEGEKQPGREATTTFNFFIPPGTWNMEYDRDKSTGEIVASSMILKKERCADITYYRSADGETCWDAPLPCSPGILKDEQLRIRHKGIAGGFIRTQKLKESVDE